MVNARSTNDDFPNDDDHNEMLPLNIDETRTINGTDKRNVDDGGLEGSLSKTRAQKQQTSKYMKLMFGTGGIYAAFLYYGSLQEDVFRYENQEGVKFKNAWFLQTFEAIANVIVGFAGLKVTIDPITNQQTTGSVLNYARSTLILFGASGVAQVTSKACNSLALAHGLSFPVATLAKSVKMGPVMAGSLLLGGASYTFMDYTQVALIIAGTTLVSAGSKRSSGSHDSMTGVLYILASLALGGLTGGLQKRLQRETSVTSPLQPYEYMFFTNAFMGITAAIIGLVLGDLVEGGSYCMRNPDILSKILQFSACSAVGQSFIFYTLAHFDPLILSTVTTSRKLFSVLISIVFKHNGVSMIGWIGMFMASVGILFEPISRCMQYQRS